MSKGHRALDSRLEALEANGATADLCPNIALLHHLAGDLRGFFTVCIASGTPEEKQATIQRTIDEL